MADKQYAERNAWELDKAGGYYMRHVQAMTAEALHSKADIAAELAHRDMRIDELEKDIDQITDQYRLFSSDVGQWRKRGSIVGVIVRDEEGKDWKWNGQDWSAA